MRTVIINGKLIVIPYIKSISKIFRINVFSYGFLIGIVDGETITVANKAKGDPHTNEYKDIVVNELTIKRNKLLEEIGNVDAITII